MRVLRSALVGALLVLGCDGGDLEDEGSADVTFTRDGEEPLRLVHDPERSSVSITPPVEGAVELTFEYQDPQVTLTVAFDADDIAEGDEVSLPVQDPLTGESLSLEVLWGEGAYDSGLAGAAGTVLFDLLEVDEATDLVDVAIELDLTLPDEVDAGPVGVDGVVSARTGG